MKKELEIDALEVIELEDEDLEGVSGGGDNSCATPPPNNNCSGHDPIDAGLGLGN